MNELMDFLTSQEIIVVYIVVAIAILLCFFIYLIDKTYYKRKQRHNTKELNKLVEYLGGKNPRLHTDEILIALSTSAATDENARAAMNQLANLRGSEAHSSVLLGSVDTGIIKKLGIHCTCEPVSEKKRLYK